MLFSPYRGERVRGTPPSRDYLFPLSLLLSQREGKGGGMTGNILELVSLSTALSRAAMEGKIMEVVGKKLTTSTIEEKSSRLQRLEEDLSSYNSRHGKKISLRAYITLLKSMDDLG